MQRLRPTQHCSQGLNRDPSHIIIRLLSRQGLTTRLRMKTQLAGIRIMRLETLTHQTRPNPSRSPELRNLLQEIIPARIEERQLRCKIINPETTSQRGTHILQCVSKTKPELLDRICT